MPDDFEFLWALQCSWVSGLESVEVFEHYSVSWCPWNETPHHKVRGGSFQPSNKRAHLELVLLHNEECKNPCTVCHGYMTMATSLAPSYETGVFIYSYWRCLVSWKNVDPCVRGCSSNSWQIKRRALRFSSKNHSIPLDLINRQKSLCTGLFYEKAKQTFC